MKQTLRLILLGSISLLVLAAAPAPIPSKETNETGSMKQSPIPMVCAFHCAMDENMAVSCLAPPIFCRPVKGMMERFEEHLKKDEK